MASLLAFSENRYLANREPPVSPTGLYDEQAQAFTERDGLDDNHSFLNNVVNSAKGYVKRGAILPADPEIILALADKVLNADAINDRRGIFTTSLRAVSRLPPGSSLGKKLNDQAIKLLYTTLPHPPQNFLGESRFRKADGSNNNLHMPELGKAGTPYAKSVQTKHPFPAHMLPDPGLVFDTLLRADEFTPHPGGNSSLTFAWAALVTHSLFRTDQSDWTINNTSSYLDLSPLYGSNQAEQDAVRKRDGRGLLLPDTFSEQRLTFLPPAVAALLVIFSRNHNYIAETILKINEKKKWSNPPPTDKNKLKTQDEEIFQTARLINCGHFMSIIFGDYVSGFLGLPRDGNTWSMNPFDPIEGADEEDIGRGQGNHVSVEFNVLYRWHATLSDEDAKWAENVFLKTVGKPHDQVTFAEVKLFMQGAHARAKAKAAAEAEAKAKAAEAQGPTELKADPPALHPPTVGGFSRGSDGRFSDADIASIFHNAIENPAGAYGARRIPPVMRTVEILGMEQARAWGCCSMNEFRTFLGLKKFESFEDWNPDPEIAGAARKLYGHIDNLELYPGLQAEAVMELGPGQGLCAGYTITRAILSDAIALVRGDRFFTTDFTPENLTSWGFQDCARDPNNGAFGAHLPKLLMRHLPHHMPWNSTYSLFPFFTPKTVRENLTEHLKIVDQYNLVKPGIGTISRPITVFNDPKRFPLTYGDRIRFLSKGYESFWVLDGASRHDQEKAMVLNALFPTEGSMTEHRLFYGRKARELVKEKSFSFQEEPFKYRNKPERYLDVVRQVINLVSVHWVAEFLCGIPLKTNVNKTGLWTEQEVWEMLEILFTCFFKNTVPEEAWSIRQQATQASKIVTDFIEKAIAEASPALGGGLFGIIGSISSTLGLTTSRPCHEFLSRLAAAGRRTERENLSAAVLGLAVGSSVNCAQALAQVVDFYLDDKNIKDRERLIQLCQKDDTASTESIKRYIREALRVDPQLSGLLSGVANGASTELGGRTQQSVNRGSGTSKVTPGVNFLEQTAPEILKAIFRLKNIRRAPGESGRLTGFTKEILGTDTRIFINRTGQLSQFPGSLFVVYDE